LGVAAMVCRTLIIAGLEWVAQNAVKPAVVSLSLGVPAGQWSQPLEDAIKHLTEVMGIAVVVAAGNSAKDSCGVAPARVPSAITVAASNIPTKFSRTQAGEWQDRVAVAVLVVLLAAGQGKGSSMAATRPAAAAGAAPAAADAHSCVVAATPCNPCRGQ
jgi:subtilisin family serine protease